MFKNINEALEYIYSFINLEIIEKKYKSKVYSLDNIRNLVSLFQIDLSSFKIIHIAGTKGKGSTTLFISYLLRLLGYNVTSFLSPHIEKINERILYNLTEIEDEEFIQIISYIKEVLDNANLTPTTFELLFLCFLLYSKIKKPDYLIVEVGLGGRLDTTNIVLPIISVITRIGYDHTEILGKSLKSIAREKAGIIKENLPVVVTEQKITAMKVIKKVCKKKNSQLFSVKKFFKLLEYKQVNCHSIISFRFKNFNFNEIILNTIGKHQIYNFFTSILTVYLIDNKILDNLLKIKSIEVKIKGRIEIISLTPLIIVDVAHNKESALALVKTLKESFPHIKWHVLSSMAKGKDYKNFYKTISTITKSLTITTCSYKESEPEKIYKLVKKYFKECNIIVDFNTAYNYFIKKDGALLITGSFYVVSPFINNFKKKADENKI